MSDIAPPPYQAVAQTFLSQYTDGKTVTNDKLNAFVAALSSDQKTALASLQTQPPTSNNNDPAQVDKFRTKVQNDMLDDQAIEVFKEAARSAVAASKFIDNMFMNLYALVAKIDSDNGLNGSDPFLPKFGSLQNTWRTILKDSQLLAADIAVYAQSFDEVILPTVSDPTLTQAQKLDILGATQVGTEGYEGRAEAINTRLGGLVDDFSHFVGTFGTWGQSKEGELKAEVTQAKKELDALLAQATSLKNVMIGFGAATGVGIAIAAGGCFAGPLAPIFWIAGGVIAGAFGLSLLAVGIEYKNVMDDINDKQNEISNLNAKLSDIQNARSSLQKAGTKDVQDIQEQIGHVTAIWTCLSSDTEAIKTWIQNGQSYEKLSVPDIVKVNLVQNQLAHAVAIYSKVAEYLNEYSSGMANSGIPAPQ